jgi:hypothetical protein
MDVSIIICSLNPVDESVKKINSYNNKGLSYEILVCSDTTEKNLDNVKHIEDPKTSVKAFNKCYKHSIGDFILTFPGGATPRNNMFDMINYLDGLTYKVSSFSGDGGDPCFVPTWSVDMYGLNHRPHILRFPSFYRSFIENYLDGVIFNESFCHHWVDNWLGIFCGKHFGSTENSNLRIETEKNHKSITKYDDHDKKVFEQLLQNSDTYNYNVEIQQ